jgi:hypothetical protein
MTADQIAVINLADRLSLIHREGRMTAIELQDRLTEIERGLKCDPLPWYRRLLAQEYNLLSALEQLK